MPAYTVEPLYVPIGQETIAADFYRPKADRKPAVIIMAHEFAALRQFKLIQYAQKFAQAGYAVVLFDFAIGAEAQENPENLFHSKINLRTGKQLFSI